MTHAPAEPKMGRASRRTLAGIPKQDYRLRANRDRRDGIDYTTNQSEENDMEFGFYVPTKPPLNTPDSMKALVSKGEELGYGYLIWPSAITSLCPRVSSPPIPIPRGATGRPDARAKFSSHCRCSPISRVRRRRRGC